jgi:hypothetical protein
VILWLVVKAVIVWLVILGLAFANAALREAVLGCHLAAQRAELCGTHRMPCRVATPA